MDSTRLVRPGLVLKEYHPDRGKIITGPNAGNECAAYGLMIFCREGNFPGFEAFGLACKLFILKEIGTNRIQTP